ncbi:MAG: twin-arginine translocase TatA/TatE family subunit [Alphaproteobacteria bacterium]|jgi:sec-independent protein translocase protein TatA|nr:twin-arginine translocase TatA/TatE family subunit [Alphaproteobacteria bacterium]
MGIGLPELLIILVIVFLVFGAGKLPEVMGQLGKGVNAFKEGASEKPTTKTVKAKESVAKATVAKKPAAKVASKAAAKPKRRKA